MPDGKNRHLIGHAIGYRFPLGVSLIDGDNWMLAENGVPADRLAVTWRKSKRSNPSGSCVEVAPLPDGAVAVRNSRYPAGPALIYTRAEIAAFLAGAKAGEFDDLA